MATSGNNWETMMIMIRRGRETGSMLIERQGIQHEVFVLSA
jgi:hypothetical protein